MRGAVADRVDVGKAGRAKFVDALQLIDLRGDGPLRIGIPSDVVRGRTQPLAQTWSMAIFNHPAGADGIIYPSRLSVAQVAPSMWGRLVLRPV